MQVLTVAGRVGRDAELRQTQGGDPVLGFSLAVDNGKDRDGNKRPATWFDCAIWGKRATSLNGFIRKGEAMTVSGRPTARTHEGKVYLGVSVDQFTFQGGAKRDDAPPQSGYGSGGAPTSHDLEDEIPFAPEVR